MSGRPQSGSVCLAGYGRIMSLCAAGKLHFILVVLLVIPALADTTAWEEQFDLGLQSAAKNDFAKAEIYFTRAVHFAEAFGPESARLGSTLNALGHIYNWRGRNRDAERVYLRAIHILDKVYGARSLDVANVSVNLGRAYFDDGQYAKSEPFFRYALSIFKASFGPDSLKIALAAFGAGEALDQAIPLLTEAADIRERTLGLMNPDFSAALNSLALVYAAQRKPQKAEPLPTWLKLSTKTLPRGLQVRPHKPTSFPQKVVVPCESVRNVRLCIETWGPK